MKIIKSLLFLMACIFMLSTCTKSEILLDDEALTTLDDESLINLDDVALTNLKNDKNKPMYVSVPFKAKFIGDYKYAGPDIEELTGLEPKCEFARVIVDFEGNGTHLGKFTGSFDFCAGPEGYGPSDSYMVAANGDTLIVSIAGKVIPGRLDEHPEYVVSYWQDPFVILGGTGRFEGASGGGTSDDYNSSLDPDSHHNWNGTITMKKGKRK